MAQQEDMRLSVHDDVTATNLPSWSHTASGLLDMNENEALYGQNEVVGWIMPPLPQCPWTNPCHGSYV